MDYNIMKMDDLLSGLIDNVSQDQLDDEIKSFKFYARKLGIRDYNQLWVAVSEDDPSFVLQDGITIPPLVKDRQVELYPSAKILIEKYNGLFYIFATSEEDIIKALETLNRFINAEMPIEDFYSEDDKEEQEENKSFIDIQESLKLRDKKSNNKYGLQTKYLSEKYTIAQKRTLAIMLREGLSDEDIYNYMQEIQDDEEIMKNFYGEEDISFRDPYAAAQEDALKDIEKGKPIDFDPENKQKLIQDLMYREGWTQDQAQDYLSYYWEVYENYIEDEYQVDDDFDWSIEE